MKVFKFILFLVLTLVAAWYAGTSHNELPPLANFLHPNTGYWQNYEKEEISLPNSIDGLGLDKDVSVSFDKLLIPHIQAKSKKDLYFAQGYITAYHRLWQMETSLRKVSGRMSEIHGPKFLEKDRLMRRKGILYGAKKSLADLKNEHPNEYETLKAYVSGINKFIDNLDDANLPLDYKLMNTKPSKWEVYHPLMILTETFTSAENYHSDILYTNTTKQGLSGIDTILFKANDHYDSLSETKQAFLKQIPLVDIVQPYRMNIAGNHMVVSPAKTLASKPIMALSFNGELSKHSLPYLVELKSNNTAVFGISIPGIPGVISGMNDALAWQLLPGGKKMVEWYNISFSDDTKKEYRYDDKLLKTQKNIEKIKIKGQPSVYDTVIYTHYGPVVYEKSFGSNSTFSNLVAKWHGVSSSELLRTILKISDTNSLEKIVTMDPIDGPLVKLTVIERNNNFNTLFLGSILSTSSFSYIRDGSISSEESFSQKSLDLQQVSTPYYSFAAKDLSDDTTSLYALSMFEDQRLIDRLKSIPQVRVEDLMNIQQDNFNFIASKFLPFALNIAEQGIDEGTRESDLLDLLKKWDYFNQRQMVTPTIFKLWWQHIIEGMEVKMNLEEQNTFFVKDEIVLTMLLSSLDKSATKDVIKSTFLKAVNNIQEINAKNKDGHKWYAFKNSRFTNYNGGIKPSELLETGGCKHCINHSTTKKGSLAKLIIELGSDQTRVWGNFLGSQTDNIGNEKHASFNSNWKKGKYYKIKASDLLKSEDILKEVKMKN